MVIMGRPRGTQFDIKVPKTKKYEVIKEFGSAKIGEIFNLPSNVDTWSLVRRGFIIEKKKV